MNINNKVRMVILLLLGVVIVATFYRYNSYKSVNPVESGINEILAAYAKKYQALEYYSGASLSVSIPNDKIRNFYYGNVSHENNARKIDSRTLFEIGSITKSFTSALVLQLEKEGKLSLSNPIEMYLQKYNKWGIVNIQQLLSMTSGIPNYTNIPEFITTIFNKPNVVWSTDQLINYAYPPLQFTPPLKQGFYYSNTGYLLAGQIAEWVTHKKLDDLFSERIFTPADLQNTFYLVTVAPEIYKRLARGYSYDPYAFPSMLGKDVTTDNLSSSGADGSMIATTEDIIKWVQILYIDHKILDKSQQAKITSLVSTNTGKPINDVSKTDPSGFGLGVFRAYDEKHPKESKWTYEGRMFGYRAIYNYIPCNQIIISAALNSSTDADNDHVEELLSDVYELIIKHHPNLRC